MSPEQTHPWNWSCIQFNKARKQCTAHRIEIEKLRTNNMTMYFAKIPRNIKILIGKLTRP